MEFCYILWTQHPYHQSRRLLMAVSSRTERLSMTQVFGATAFGASHGRWVPLGWIPANRLGRVVGKSGGVGAYLPPSNVGKSVAKSGAPQGGFLVRRVARVFRDGVISRRRWSRAP